MVWDPVWDDIFRKQPWGKYPAEDLIRFVAKNYYDAAARSELRLLEVGCGPGANLWFIAREGFQAYGVDGSPTAINLAKTRLDLECPGWKGEVQCAEISQLPYADMTFDGVIDNECIYCNSFESSRAIYRELARVTKKGGRLFSRTFASGSWGDGTGEAAGHHAWFCGEGPLAGKGLSRYTSSDEINDLVEGWTVECVGMVTHTRGSIAHTVKEFIIEGVRND